MADLPREVLENTHILAEVYLPESQKAASRELDLRGNVVCYLYTPEHKQLVCVGSDPHMRALA